VRELPALTLDEVALMASVRLRCGILLSRHHRATDTPTKVRLMTAMIAEVRRHDGLTEADARRVLECILADCDKPLPPRDAA